VGHWDTKLVEVGKVAEGGRLAVEGGSRGRAWSLPSTIILTLPHLALHSVNFRVTMLARERFLHGVTCKYIRLRTVA
jgi:hypothetical protein